MKKNDLITLLTTVTSSSDPKITIKKVESFFKPDGILEIILTKDDLLNLTEAIKIKKQQTNLRYIKGKSLTLQQDRIFKEFYNIFHFEMNADERKWIIEKFGIISEILKEYSQDAKQIRREHAAIFSDLHSYVEHQQYQHQMSDVGSEMGKLPEEVGKGNIAEAQKIIEEARRKLQQVEIPGGFSNRFNLGSCLKDNAAKPLQDLEKELRQFAAGGDFIKVEQLLKQIDNPNAKGAHSGNAALHEVIINLANGKMAKMNDGKNILQNALKCIDILCKAKKADVNVRDKEGNTPFILAASLLPKEDRIAVLKELQTLGVNTALKNNAQKTGIDYHQEALEAEKAQWKKLN